MASIVTSLPEALTPWSVWLKWFAPELAADIGPLLQRLQPLLGPFKGHSQGGEADWDGLDDLRTRGPYERLLATEWLLADELPDEFLRRAVSGEHLFLSPRPRRRRAQRSIIALFDAGPLQLGAPRLGHIALWILLARRAVQAQGEMRWGVLQRPGELVEASEPQHLKAMLEKRSFTTPESTHLDQWRATLDEPRYAEGERWIIGSPHLNASGAPFTHRVHLRKELKGTVLEVTLAERGAERTIGLPMPEQDSVISLLRGSFDASLGEQVNAANSHAVSLQRPPIISMDGTRVGVALRDEPAAMVFFVPRSADESSRVPRQHHWSHGYSALSASLIGKTMGVLMSDAETLRFWPTSMSIKPFPPQKQFHAPGNIAAWMPAAWLRGSHSQRICVIDQSKRLLQWDTVIHKKREVNTDTELRPVTENALALTQLSKDVAAFAHYDDGRVWFSRINASDAATGRRLLCEAPKDTVVMFGRGCFCAVRVTPETWRICNWNDPSQSYEATVPAQMRVIGVVRDQQTRIGLLLMDRVHLGFQGCDGESALLYTAPSPITSYSVCPNSGLVAMLTVDRHLIAVSAATRELRLCVLTGRDSHAYA